MQAGDLRDLPNAPMPAATGFASGNPAALLFIGAAQNQEQILMILPLRMLALLARWATTFPLRTIPRHVPPPP
jgi:hypothetical protein